MAEPTQPIAKYHLVKDGIAYRIEIPSELREIPAKHRYSFDFTVYEHDSDVRFTKQVHLLSHLHSEKTDMEQTIIAVRALYGLLGTSDESRALGTNFPPEFLSFENVDREETRQRILIYAQERDNVLFDEPFHIIEFISAIHINPQALVRQLHYWENRGMLRFDVSTSKRVRKRAWNEKIFDRILLNEDRVPVVPIVSHPVDPYKHYKILPIEADRFDGGFIFCMTEFSGDGLRRFSEVIEPLCEPQFAMPAIISKHDDLPYKIDDKVVSHIHKCSLAIADISTRNPNVMYELGFAHAINKDVIIICDRALRGEKEIFDIRNINTIFFDNDEHLRDELKKKIRAVLNTNGTTKPS